jgi:hypothetical protein
MAKSHGLSLQFIRMELSGFNVEPEQNDLVSGILGKIYVNPRFGTNSFLERGFPDLEIFFGAYP